MRPEPSSHRPRSPSLLELAVALLGGIALLALLALLAFALALGLAQRGVDLVSGVMVKASVPVSADRALVAASVGARALANALGPLEVEIHANLSERSVTVSVGTGRCT